MPRDPDHVLPPASAGIVGVLIAHARDLAGPTDADHRRALGAVATLLDEFGTRPITPLGIARALDRLDELMLVPSDGGDRG